MLLVDAGYSTKENRLATQRAYKDKLRRVESLRLLNQYGSLFMKDDTAKGVINISEASILGNGSLPPTPSTSIEKLSRSQS